MLSFAVWTGNAQTHSGLTCEDAIPLGSEYNGNVPGAGTYWYIANSYDLPLKIHFAPADGASQISPVVEVDFTCTPGEYDNPKLDSIINLAEGWGYEMPLEFTCNLDVVDGRNEFSMSVPKSYRDILASFGLTENITAYVKVTYGGAGGVGLAPDTAFSSCMDRGAIVTLGSTLNVRPLDADTHFVFPLAKWQNDSVRFVWQGTSPADVYLSTICDYEFDVFDDANKIYDIFAVQPYDTFRLTNADIKRALDWPENNGGLYYMKIYSQTSGKLKVERIPQAPPKGDATLLRYDVASSIPADTNALFAMPHTWTKSTMFTTPTDRVFKMYIGATYDFLLPNAIATYQFHANDDGHWLGLTEEQMQDLWTQAPTQYLYIRFECSENTTLTPTLWTIPTCLTTQEILRPSTTLDVKKGNLGAVYYRFYYREWKGGDMKFQWKTNASTCPTFIGKNCTFPASATNTNVIDNKPISRNGSWTINAADIAEWEGSVDEDGYLYVRFNPGNAGTMVVSTTAPEEQDPAPIEYPRTTINVVCIGEPTAAGQQLIVLVSQDQNLAVYAGDTDQIVGLEPIDSWSQTTADEPHSLVLPSGIYTLKGNEETIRVVVQ